MTLILDTSVLIDHLRGVVQAREAMREAVVEGHRLATSVLTRVEVLAGMRPDEADATGRLFASLDWVGVDEVIADRAGHLANRYLRSHPGVDPVDYVVAATALHLDAQLWTRNIKHFPMFPDLVAPY